MRNVVRALVGLVGLFNLLLAARLLFDTAGAGVGFFLVSDGIQGLATMRADFTAFFLTNTIFALNGAWRGDGKPLLVPLSLLGIALSGRFVSLAVDGVSPTAFLPMAAEAAMIAILLAGRQVLGTRR